MWACSLKSPGRQDCAVESITLGLRNVIVFTSLSSPNEICDASACASVRATAGSPPAMSASGLNGRKKLDSQRLYRSSSAIVVGTTCHAVSAPRSHQNGTLAGSSNV